MRISRLTTTSHLATSLLTGVSLLAIVPGAAAQQTEESESGHLPAFLLRPVSVKA